MAKKIALYTVAIILLVIVVLFLIPIKEKSFSEYYHGDKAIEASLSKFRQHPLKSISHQHNDWEYLSIGKGEKAILFLHGMGGAYDIWFQQIAQLKTDFRILSLTMPTVHSLEEATNGILQILDKEHIEKVSIVGTSMGGYIGQYFLSKHSNRLDKIVLGNTFPPNDFYIEQNGKMRKIVPLLPEWLVMDNFRKNAGVKVIPASENSQLVNAYLMEQYSGLMSKAQFIGRFDMVLEYFEVKRNDVTQSIPKLIIESDNDPLVTKELREQLKSTYPEAKVFTFSQKGHFPYLNRPERYTATLREFLTD